jgi:ectoine hydroxylase-related dioxygenase (phytanoyl-CoA dioxygenase family)
MAQDGFLVARRVLNTEDCASCIDDVAPLLAASPAGVRELASKSSVVFALAESRQVRNLIEPILGPAARLVRSILFNKTAEANWQVAWHQDLSIAVASKVEMDGYGAWSVKDGVVHVQAPDHVLRAMLTIRIHLDHADESNGALWVAPGTHRLGKIRVADASDVVEQHGKQLCACDVGDALLMSPLLLHASRKMTSNLPRRVVHLEFSGCSLPAPMEWAESLQSVARTRELKN